MIRSLLYIRLAAQEPTSYTIPLLEQVKALVPEVTTFEFDNFSEESIRQYAAELLKQSEKAAVVVSVEALEAPVGGLATLLNRLLKAKPAVLLMVLQGEQPLLQKMMQTIAGPQFYQNIADAKLQQLLKDSLS